MLLILKSNFREYPGFGQIFTFQQERNKVCASTLIIQKRTFSFFHGLIIFVPSVRLGIYLWVLHKTWTLPFVIIFKILLILLVLNPIINCYRSPKWLTTPLSLSLYHLGPMHMRVFHQSERPRSNDTQTPNSIHAWLQQSNYSCNISAYTTW